MPTYPVTPLNDTCMTPDCDQIGELLVEHHGRIIGRTCGPHAEAALRSGEAEQIRSSTSDIPVLVLADPRSTGPTTFGA